MTFFGAFTSTKDWRRKIAIMSLFHNRQLIQNKEWTIKQTAKYFKVSVGLASENLRLSSRFDELTDCTSRADALRRIK